MPHLTVYQRVNGWTSTKEQGTNQNVYFNSRTSSWQYGSNSSTGLPENDPRLPTCIENNVNRKFSIYGILKISANDRFYHVRTTQRTSYFFGLKVGFVLFQQRLHEFSLSCSLTSILVSIKPNLSLTNIFVFC